VANVEATCQFYARTLGIKSFTDRYDNVELRFSNQSILLHGDDHLYYPRAHSPKPGSADVCFRTTASILDVAHHLEKENVLILQEPEELTSAIGLVHFYDPDGNLVEVLNH
jgi:catechol 2,3-dioxygenase-like lactoylglutathione lyase family enzyme